MVSMFSCFHIPCFQNPCLIPLHLLFSMMAKFMEAVGKVNITYHPILDNYRQYDKVPRTSFNNNSLIFPFVKGIGKGIKMCPHSPSRMSKGEKKFL